MTLQQLISAGRDLLTRKEAAEILRVKPNTLAVWAVKGWYADELPTVRLSRTAIRYRRADVERFIASRAGAANSTTPTRMVECVSNTKDIVQA